MFLIFRKCQPWVALCMLLNFCQISGSCSYKIVLIKKVYTLFYKQLAYKQLALGTYFLTYLLGLSKQQYKVLDILEIFL